ncbi:hypothetical protein Ddye_030854 [Dipteronia dyeriana]|uniref:Uncharacterized protein n=1 Tax=Dipteronia dyeriana TaxID=168575 RepID=A0AAD9WMX8_9ROSI|nr:hypothetical protein Ddye_030854 [Dipteronia dyeriana]
MGLAVSDYLNLEAYPIMYGISVYLIHSLNYLFQCFIHVQSQFCLHCGPYRNHINSVKKYFPGLHIELEYKLNVEDYLKDLPSYKKELLVQKFAAVGTLKAYLSHFRDVEDEYENAKMNLNANK